MLVCVLNVLPPRCKSSLKDRRAAAPEAARPGSPGGRRLSGPDPGDQAQVRTAGFPW